MPPQGAGEGDPAFPTAAVFSPPPLGVWFIFSASLLAKGTM